MNKKRNAFTAIAKKIGQSTKEVLQFVFSWTFWERLSGLSGVAALLLSAYIFVVDRTEQDLGKIVERNTHMDSLISEQNKELIRHRNNERRIELNKLRFSVSQLIHLCDGGLNQFETWDKPKRMEYISYVNAILESQLNNTFILENETTTQKWSQVYSDGRFTFASIQTPIENCFVVGEDHIERKMTSIEYAQKWQRDSRSFYLNCNKLINYLLDDVLRKENAMLFF